jgi:hypothetical protein
MRSICTICAALLYPEPTKRGRGNKADTTKSLETKDFSSARLSQARAVLRHSRELHHPYLPLPSVAERRGWRVPIASVWSRSSWRVTSPKLRYIGFVRIGL